MENTVKAKRAKALKTIKWMLFLGSILFIISIFLPFYTFYYTDYSFPDHGTAIYGFQSIFTFFFGVYFLLAVLSFLTFNKIIVHIMNPLLLLALLLTMALNVYVFGWWGASPFHPDIRFGFYVNTFLVVAVIICSYSMLPAVKDFKQPKWIFRILLTVIIAIPTLLFVYSQIKEHIESNKPKMTAELYVEKNGIKCKEEWWAWKGENARFTKYYSTSVNSGASYVLDSIKVTFSGQRTRTETRKAINGKLELEDFLEEE